jgi:glycosyltransferase involved in cell wall biosynthesis
VIEPDTTIFVISYNYGHFLPGGIESALDQDAPAKVVVVDDGSTDDTRSVASGYGDRIGYLWKPNGGLSDARNFALARCDTPYLMFLDADDRIPSEFIRVTRRALEADPDAAFVYTQLAYFTVDEDLCKPDPEVTKFPPFSAERLKRGNFINSAALLRLPLARAVGYDTHLRYGLEDWEFFISLAERGAHGLLVDGTTLRCRTHSKSMGQTLQRRNTARRLTYLYVVAKHWRFFGLVGAFGFVRRSARSRMAALTRRR